METRALSLNYNDEEHAIVFKGCGKVLHSDTVKKYEERINAKLPGDYCAFLENINGGRPVLRGMKLKNWPDPAPGNIGAFPPSDDFSQFSKKEQLVFKNIYIPVTVAFLFGITHAPYYSLDYLSNEVVVCDKADTGSIIWIGSTDDDMNLYMSLCTDLYGHIYFANLDVYGVSRDEKTDAYRMPLRELESQSLVANSFAEFLTSLFSAKMLLSDGFIPTKKMYNEYPLYDGDDPDINDCALSRLLEGMAL